MYINLLVSIFLILNFSFDAYGAAAPLVSSKLEFDQKVALLSQALAARTVPHKVEDVQFSVESINKFKDEKYKRAFINYSLQNLTTTNKTDQQTIIHLIKKHKDALGVLTPEIEKKYLEIDDEILIAAARCDPSLKKLREAYELAKEIKIVPPVQNKEPAGITLALSDNGKMVIKELRPLDFEIGGIRCGFFDFGNASWSQEASILIIAGCVVGLVIAPALYNYYMTPEKAAAIAKNMDFNQGFSAVSEYYGLAQNLTPSEGGYPIIGTRLGD